MRFEVRVIASFKALAAGDAIGKQTETLPFRDIRKWYPSGITGFHGRPGDVIPRYAGKRYEWRVGETTDDTEQTLAVAKALLLRGEASHEEIGRQLLQCKKSLHPGVSLWNFVQAGDPARTASSGDGCGAAMRAAPLGVLYPSGRLDDLVRGAYECSIPTHGGSMAICAAAAVAAAVSAALEGRPGPEVLRVALRASRKAEALRPPEQPTTIARSIEQIYFDLAGKKHLAAEEIVQQYFPGNPQTIVPLAISLAVITGSAEATTLLAANLGGDSDSVASIGSAIAGALHPHTVNEEWFEAVLAVNGDSLLDVVIPLSSLRRSS